MIDIRHIEAFVMLAHEGSFSQAAERLNLTQPSLSARIRQMEQLLGSGLISRAYRPIELTETGKLFLPYAERVLGILEAGIDAVKVAEAGTLGVLSVGCPISVSTYLMPKVVEQFSQRYPQAELFIETSHSNNLIQQLQDGLINLAFTAVFPHLIRDTDVLLRLRDEMVVAVWPDHPLTRREGVTLADLWTYRLMLPRWGNAFDAYIKTLRDPFPTPKPMVRVPLAAGLPMLGESDLVTFVPRRLALVTQLAILDLAEIQFNWDVVLVTRSGRALSDLEEAFVALVRQVS